MENVQHAFYEASHWNVDNSYGALNATARGESHFTLLHHHMLIAFIKHFSISIYLAACAFRYRRLLHQTSPLPTRLAVWALWMAPCPTFTRPCH